MFKHAVFLFIWAGYGLCKSKMDDFHTIFHLQLKGTWKKGGIMGARPVLKKALHLV